MRNHEALAEKYPIASDALHEASAEHKCSLRVAAPARLGQRGKHIYAEDVRMIGFTPDQNPPEGLILHR